MPGYPGSSYEMVVMFKALFSVLLVLLQEGWFNYLTNKCKYEASLLFPGQKRKGTKTASSAVARNARKREVNWNPLIRSGEDADSCEARVRWVKDESIKRAKYMKAKNESNICFQEGIFTKLNATTIHWG